MYWILLLVWCLVWSIYHTTTICSERRIERKTNHCIGLVIQIIVAGFCLIQLGAI